MNIQYRQAEKRDVDGLFDLIQYYAEQGIMLPRAKEILVYLLHDFVVAEDLEHGRIIGCGSLCKLGDELVEIRSLGVRDDYKGYGIGKKLVQMLIAKAIELKIPNVMALTYEVAFFERNGFSVVPMSIFPEKVWTDCVHCSKQDHCDEIAVLKRIN